MNLATIPVRLLAHLEAGGTLNDSTVDDLYRECHGTPAGDETDLEQVERWAWQVAQTQAKKSAFFKLSPLLNNKPSKTTNP